MREMTIPPYPLAKCFNFISPCYYCMLHAHFKHTTQHNTTSFIPNKKGRNKRNSALHHLMFTKCHQSHPLTTTYKSPHTNLQPQNPGIMHLLTYSTCTQIANDLNRLPNLRINLHTNFPRSCEREGRLQDLWICTHMRRLLWTLHERW